MAGLNELPALALRLVSIEGKVDPLSEDVLYKISKLPEVKSSHTTYTLLPERAIIALAESPALLLKFFVGSTNVAPPSVLLYRKCQ